MGLFKEKEYSITPEVLASLLSEQKPKKRTLREDLNKNFKRKPRQKKTDKPHLPRVDMLPIHLILENRRREMVRIFMMVAMGIVAAVGLVWFSQSSEVNSALAELESANAEVQQSQQSQSQLSPIQDYYNNLELKITTHSDLVRKELNYSEITKGVYTALPPGVAITSFTIDPTIVNDPDAPAGQQPAQPDASGATPLTCGAGTNDPYNQLPQQATLGCVTISGTAPDVASVTSLAQSLNGVSTLINPFVTTSGTTPGAAGTTPQPGVPTAEGTVPWTATASIATTAAVQGAPLANISGLPGIGGGNNSQQTQPQPTQPQQPATTPSTGTGQNVATTGNGGVAQ